MHALVFCTKIKNASAYKDVCSQGHAWAPAHFNPVQLAKEEGLIKFNEEAVHIWVGIIEFPKGIYH